jgi:hypothetical protein
VLEDTISVRHESCGYGGTSLWWQQEQQEQEDMLVSTRGAHGVCL